MSIPDEILKKGIAYQISTPLDIHYNPDTKQLKLTCFQGVMSTSQAFPVHLEFDALSSRQLLLALDDLIQVLEIDISEDPTITYS